VPVGEDQLPHLELTRDIAKRFNQLYCDVSPHTPDNEYMKAGGVFPVIKPLVGRTKRLVGTGAPKDGKLLKMSKSLNNSVLLSDDNDTIHRKIMKMYTDPSRLKASDPGTVENNPLWIFHDTFNPDKTWVNQAKEQYRAGTIGDVACKKQLIDVLITLIEPMRERRALYANDKAQLLDILKEGTARANVYAEKTLSLAKHAMKQDYLKRQLNF
jgi:tryptophanyl-tRNA synthetase